MAESGPGLATLKIFVKRPIGFLFEDMPTGKCTFIYGNRRVTRMITRKEKIELDAPAAVNLEARAPMVAQPDLAALNAERIASLQQQKNFDKFEADVKAAIGQVAVKMTAAYAEYDARYQAAMTTIKDQQRLLRKNKIMAWEQKDALSQELDQARRSLNDERNRTRKALSTLNSQYSKAQREISKEIQQEERSLKAHVVGLQPGKPSLVAVENDWGATCVPRTKKPAGILSM